MRTRDGSRGGRGGRVKNPLCCMLCISPIRTLGYIPACVCMHYRARRELISTLGEEYVWLNGCYGDTCVPCVFEPVGRVMETSPRIGLACEVVCCHMCVADANRVLLGRAYGLEYRTWLDGYCTPFDPRDYCSGAVGSCCGLLFLGCQYTALGLFCSPCIASQVQTELNHQAGKSGDSSDGSDAGDSSDGSDAGGRVGGRGKSLRNRK